MIHPGLALGSEVPSRGELWPWMQGWSVYPTDTVEMYSQPVIGRGVFSNPDWDWTRFDFDRDQRVFEDKLGAVLNASNSDLSGFKARGGKLLIFQDWSDALISPQGSID